MTSSMSSATPVVPASAAPRRQRLGGLTLAALVIAVLAVVPILAVAINVFAGGTAGTWSHLVSTVLPEYVGNTIKLLLGVGAGVIFGGVAAAWLTVMHDFPGRRVFEWALILPLAMPAYVMAYTYTDLLQFVGPVQTALRAVSGWEAGEYWFPDVRSVGGAILMFVFVLYPYVYMLARTAFLERASGMI
jgi:iron(III) transport system permease protein